MYYAVVAVRKGKIDVPFTSTNRAAALKELKKYPVGRMLMFETQQALQAFVDKPYFGAMLDCAPAVEVQRCFKAAVVASDVGHIGRMLRTHRGLLFNNKQKPRLYNSNHENILHIAARQGLAKVCDVILHTVRNPNYISWANHDPCITPCSTVTKMVCRYLNAANRSMGETPLHLASKRGFPAVVSVLTAYPHCQSLRNKNGQRPYDVNTVSAVTAQLLLRNYFVPLIRTEANLEMPYVGEPFARDNHAIVLETQHKLMPARYIKALAGPMTLEEAIKFQRQWQTAPRLTVLSVPTLAAEPHFRCAVTNRVYSKSELARTPGYSERVFRRTRLDSAMERIGRHLARTHDVRWTEQWNFLRMPCNLAEPTGLAMLETYLKSRWYKLKAYGSEPDYAIGDNLFDEENMHAMIALSMVQVDPHCFPAINCWRLAMYKTYGTDILDKTVVMDVV